MPATIRSRGRRGHLVICGDDALAARVAEELSVRYGERVTVILPARESTRGARIARLPDVRVIERPDLSADAFREAQVQSARALALLRQDDLGNFHAALRAQELNPGLRIVVAIFNNGLGERMRSFFTDCAVLSEAAMSAPSFVAAALGEPAPSHVRLSGRTMYVARPAATDPGHVICGVRMPEGTSSPQLLPPGSGDADLVLAVADGSPRNPLARQARHPVRAAAGALRAVFGHKLGVVFLFLLGVLLCGFVLLLVAARYSWANALYLTAMDMAGAALTNPALHAPDKFAQFLLTFDGMAILPVVTAAIVGARLTGSVTGRERPVSGHVIVAGLGNLGARVVGQLHDLGVDVVAVDRREDAAGVPMARRLGVRVVTGAISEETMRSAGIATAAALVSVAHDDAVNLETALLARALREDLRIVLRLYDDDLAQRVQRTIGSLVSRSAAYMAAPAFTAAMLNNQVLRTIPVGRHVLLIAEIPIGAGAELAGRPLEDVHEDDAIRVIALRRGGATTDWDPWPGYRVQPEDRLFVLATRAGLGRVLARSKPPRELPAG